MLHGKHRPWEISSKDVSQCYNSTDAQWKTRDAIVKCSQELLKMWLHSIKSSHCTLENKGSWNSYHLPSYHCEAHTNSLIILPDPQNNPMPQ